MLPKEELLKEEDEENKEYESHPFEFDDEIKDSLSDKINAFFVNYGGSSNSNNIEIPENYQ